MSDRRDIYVRCPFYKRAERQHIICEGVEDGATTHVAFSSPLRLNEYMSGYCDCDYSHCRVTRMLEEKWDSILGPTQ